jgi:hypothetical protein
VQAAGALIKRQSTPDVRTPGVKRTQLSALLARHSNRGHPVFIGEQYSSAVGESRLFSGVTGNCRPFRPFSELTKSADLYGDGAVNDLYGDVAGRFGEGAAFSLFVDHCKRVGENMLCEVGFVTIGASERFPPLHAIAVGPSKEAAMREFFTPLRENGDFELLFGAPVKGRVGLPSPFLPNLLSSRESRIR